MPDALASNPFAALSLIGAPALLTNAASLLALSTSNRFLRASERMRDVVTQLDEGKADQRKQQLAVRQVDSLETQAMLLLGGLRAAYVALASFAGASIVATIGASLGPLTAGIFVKITAPIALITGIVGASGLVWACVSLFRATRLSLYTISAEAALMRERRAEREQSHE